MFLPTHRHADGGLYQYVGPQKGRSYTGTNTWEPGVAYRNEEGDLFWTDDDRWAHRFEKIDDVSGGLETSVLIEDEGDTVAYYKFKILEAGDVRHVFISAGPMPGAAHAMSREFLDWMKRVFESQAEMISMGLHIREHDFPDLIGDVRAFHAKFGQEYLGKPRQLPDDLHDFRVKFHDEETHEYRDEYPKLGDAIVRKDRRDIVNILELQLDALCDAAWVVLGTADLQFGRAAFIEAWKRVVKANMAKVKVEVKEDGTTNAADTGRKPKYDIGKPPGWLAPDHRDLVQDNAIFDEIFVLPASDIETNTFNQDASSYSDTRQI